ncbi:MAG TPA: tyrosine--tRNA ligase [Planctomycetota bacterium]|nr:tyrosine--tRNA ligase [Planctomycetota bacterium]
MGHPFLDDLTARGLIYQMTGGGAQGGTTLAERLSAGPTTAYIGFDPTAKSLHVGSLLQILMLVRLQRHGHRPLAIVGGGTGLIGDPSFKASERAMLTTDLLAENLAGIRSQLERFLDFDGPRGALLLNNADWLTSVPLIEFLRDVGKHFTVNQMIARDSVTQRLDGREQGLSFTEFTYALLQAYDYVVLSDRFGCDLQMGASDQWGNILDGIDLIRRMRGRSAFGLTTPLVTKADGTKFGKTESGSVWLDPELTKPFQFFQFWLNGDDANVLKYLDYFTFLDADERHQLAEQHRGAPEKRIAHRALAREITRLVHGEDALASALKATAVLFEGGDLRGLTESELLDAFAETPRTVISKSLLETPEAQWPAVIALSGLESSKGKARKAIESGAISVNGTAVTSPELSLTLSDILPGGFVVLRRGKKTYHILEIR